jgi:hypothetical protein
MSVERLPIGTQQSAILRVFSFPVLLGAFLVVAVLLVARTFHVDSDTWWHMTVGERILATHSWPSSDTYSFTAAGAPWIAYEWLGEATLALAWRLGGLTGLMALLLAVTSTMVLLLYYWTTMRCGNAKAAFLACLLVLPLEGVWFTLHPQLLGYTLLVFALVCLERFRQGRRRSLWLLPAVFLLWVNTHGTFVFGFVAMLIYWVSGLAGFRPGNMVATRWNAEQRRDLAAVCLLSLLAACVTPYGTRLVAYPLQMVVYQPVNLAEIATWQPLNFSSWPGKLFLVFVLLFLAGQVIVRPIWRLEEVAILLFSLYMAATHSRALILFALIVAPFLATLLVRWVPRYNAAQDRHLLNALLIFLLGAGLLKFFPSRHDLEDDVASVFPRRAVEHLRKHPVRGPMLNDLTWGGYLLWTLGTGRKVFIDGRVDLYEASGVFSDYLQITRLRPETFPLLHRHNVQSCLLAPNEALATLLAASSDWQKAYEDRVAIVFVRTQRYRGCCHFDRSEESAFGCGPN